jgi:hypothetical protein
VSETPNQENRFVGYEYREVTVSQKMEPVYTDGYANFGWTLEGVAPSIQRYSCLILKFKRDHKIRNKMELTRLQRQFDSCVSEIERLEMSKSIGASIVAYTLGILGLAFTVGAVFALIGGRLALGILLALPALAGWVAPYWCYVALRRRKTAEVDPYIDKKYDEIYEVCEKANSLLAN